MHPWMHVLLQLGRKTLFLISIPLLFVVGLTLAILIQLDLQSIVVRYFVVFLIFLYAFPYSVSWLYVSCSVHDIHHSYRIEFEFNHAWFLIRLLDFIFRQTFLWEVIQIIKKPPALTS